MSRKKRLVVIGGVAAGLSAGSYVKRRRPDIEVLVLEKSPHASYGSCGLPYLIEGLVGEPEELIARPIEELRERRGLDVRVEHEALNIDTEKRSVSVRDIQANREFEAPYDHLVISTGACAVIPSFPGVDADGVFTLRTLEDGIELEAYIKKQSPKSVAIVGGGYIGMEMAEAFSARGFKVTVIEKLPRVLVNYDEEISEKVTEKLIEKDINLLAGSSVKAIERSRKLTKVITDNETVETELVLLGVGIKPNTDLAKNAGIKLGESGAIKVNENMETSIPGIYACGDCAEAYHRILKRNVWIPLGDTANKEGRVAGANIAEEDFNFPGIIGTSATKVFELEVARTGLGEEEATKEGFDIETTFVHSHTRAHYYPGRKQISIKLISEKGTKKLLGAQAVGEEAVAKRIDVFAAAIWSEMTLDDIAWLDLTYVPPVSTVWDPVLVAAQVALKKAGAKGA